MCLCRGYISSYNPSNNLKIYLCNGVSLCGQPLPNLCAKLSQSCKVVSTLHKMPQPCDNPTTLQSCTKARHLHIEVVGDYWGSKDSDQLMLFQ